MVILCGSSLFIASNVLNAARCVVAVNVVGGFAGGERGLKIFVEEGDFMIADPQQGMQLFAGMWPGAVHTNFGYLLDWEVIGVESLGDTDFSQVTPVSLLLPYRHRQACTPNSLDPPTLIRLVWLIFLMVN